MAGIAAPERSRDPAPRFGTARSTLLVDRCMTYFITIGGIAVVVAVLGIFIFMLSQILPLFRGAHVQALTSVQLPHCQIWLALVVLLWAAIPQLRRQLIGIIEPRRRLLQPNLDVRWRVS